MASHCRKYCAFSPETRVPVVSAAEDPERLADLSALRVDFVMRKSVEVAALLHWLGL